VSALLDAALELHSAGFNVLPTPPRQKRPTGRWKHYEAERQTERAVRDLFEAAGDGAGLFVVLGGAWGVVVLDCDDKTSLAWWSARLGDVMESTARVKTSNGFHYYFSVPRGEKITNRRSNGGETGKWDLKADGGGVVAPPSVHESGHVYAWVDGHGLDQLQPAPAGLLEVVGKTASGAEAGSNDPRAGDGGSAGLADLLAHPPQGEGSGRNVWLASVAGHYALRFDRRSDYDLHVRRAAETLEPPLPEAEIAKLLPSIWDAEQAKHERDSAQREEKVREELARLDIRQEARARLGSAAWEPPPSTLDLSDELAIPDPEIRWAVEELLPAGGNAVLAAQYKAGKTTLTINLVKALADGLPFLGFPTTMGEGRVAVLNGEMSDAAYRLWLRRAQIGHPERAAVLHLKGRPNPLATPDGIAWLTEWLADREVRVVVLDTYGALFTGDNENDNSQARRFLTTLDEAKHRAGVGELLLVAHTGRAEHEHGAEHVRGATVLDDWCDARWVLTEKGDVRYLRAHGRDVDLPESSLRFEPAAARYSLAVLGQSRKAAAGVEKNAERRTLAVESARGQDGIRKGDLKKRMEGGGRNDARGAAIDSAVALGELVQLDGRYYVPGEEPGANQTTLEDPR
jgi:hypothetical protein